LTRTVSDDKRLFRVDSASGPGTLSVVGNGCTGLAEKSLALAAVTAHVKATNAMIDATVFITFSWLCSSCCLATVGLCYERRVAGIQSNSGFGSAGTSVSVRLAANLAVA
jgi:hypothetical protein